MKAAISTAATAYPGPLRITWVGGPLIVCIRWKPTASLTHLSAYWIAASVSTGARVTDPSQ